MKCYVVNVPTPVTCSKVMAKIIPRVQKLGYIFWLTCFVLWFKVRFCFVYLEEIKQVLGNKIIGKDNRPTGLLDKGRETDLKAALLNFLNNKEQPEPEEEQEPEPEEEPEENAE